MPSNAEYQRWYYHNKMSPEVKARKRERNRLHREKNPDYYKEYRGKNKLKAQVHGCMARVKHYYPDLISTLTKEQLTDWMMTANKTCPYCGQDAGSIDHVIPLARGGKHELDNLEMICLTCNKAKMDMTKEEFLGWIRKVQKYMAANPIQPPVIKE